MGGVMHPAIQLIAALLLALLVEEFISLMIYLQRGRQ